MNALEKRTLDAFKRVRDFDAAHDFIFPAGTLGRDLFDLIGGLVPDLESLACTESEARGSARRATVTKQESLAGIVKILGILSRTTRAMSYAAPGLEDKFRMPLKQDGQEIVSAARAALVAAEPLKAEFLRHEVRERIFTELASYIDAYEAALKEQNNGREASLKARASIDATIKRGLNGLRQLDPLIRNRLQNDDVTLAAWRSARHVERASHRKRKSNPNTSTTPTTSNT